jgi:hypothetical protein
MSVDTATESPYALAGEITSLLKGKPRASQKEALRLVASTMGLRVIPIGIPLARTSGPPPSRGGVPMRSSKRASDRKPSKKEKDEVLLSLVAQRQVIVDDLKTAKSESDRTLKIANLRNAEAAIKARKAEIRPTAPIVAAAASDSSAPAAAKVSAPVPPKREEPKAKTKSQ